MIDSVLTVGNQVIILFILIGIGALCKKTKILSDASVKGMTDFVLYIVTPCVIINSYQREFEPEKMTGLLITAGAAVASYAVDIIVSNVLIHDKDKRRQNVLRFGAVFSNCGYMSLPLQAALLGEEGVFYGATYVAVFNIVLWTYGVAAMSGSVKNVSLKKAVLNPGVLGTLAGVLLYAASVSLPSTVHEPISYLAALNTPIPMVIVGYRLIGTSFKIKGAASYVAMVLRLIVSPVIMLGGLYVLGIRGAILAACVVAASAPCAASTTMFAEKFGGDTSLSAALVSVTTLLSVVTMPLIVGLATMIM